MYLTSSLQGAWHHIHGCLHQICQCKVQFDQYVTTNIGVLFPYMASLYNAVATSCNQSFYKSHQGGNSQLQSSCDQLRFSPVASPSEKLQLDFKTLVLMAEDDCWLFVPAAATCHFFVATYILNYLIVTLMYVWACGCGHLLTVCTCSRCSSKQPLAFEIVLGTYLDVSVSLWLRMSTDCSYLQLPLVACIREI